MKDILIADDQLCDSGCNQRAYFLANTREDFVAPLMRVSVQL